MSTDQIETRNFVDVVELRDMPGEPLPHIVGHAAVFNSFSSPLPQGFVEIIRPGAFTRAIREGDVRALFNHNKDNLLGRSKAGTLQLVEDQRGLFYDITPMDDDPLVRKLIGWIRRGDITGSSFTFKVRPGGELWRREGDKQVRELLDVDVFDVSPVTFPAYVAADVALRSLEMWQQEQARSSWERERRLRLLKLAQAE